MPSSFVFLRDFTCTCNTVTAVQVECFPGDIVQLRFFGDRRFRAAFRRFSIQKEYVAQNNAHEMGGAFPASGAKYVLSFAHAFLFDKPGRPLYCLDRGSMHGGESAKVGEKKIWEQELDAWDRLLRRVPQPFTLKLSQILVYPLDLDTVPENGHLPPCGGPGI